MSASLAAMLTVGVIARRIDRPIHRIEYVIRTRNIPAIGMAGNARVYGDEAVALITSELERIDSARAAREVASCR